MTSIVLQKEHVSCGSQDEEQQKDGIDWHIRYDRRHLAQSLRSWSIRWCFLLRRSLLWAHITC
jgi:hypothetical protein